VSSGRSPALRLRQGFVLLAGAIVFSLIVGSGPDTFYWTPLGIGLVYLASAVSGGRAGGYWSGALVLVGWGAAVAYAREARPDVDIAGLYLAGAGIGACVAIAAQRLGIKVDPLGAALTVVVAGAILAFSDALPELTDARTYAAFVGAVGLVNIAWALLEDRSG
jgi:hypothetical protein